MGDSWLRFNKLSSVMTIEETTQRIDALSARAKSWLRQTCEQMADDHSLSDAPTARTECEAAGLVRKSGRYLDIDPTVQLLVHGEQYLASRSPSR